MTTVSNDWLEKLQEDMKVSKANIGIIFSRALPKNFNKNETVIFLHTGGLPALFTFSEELATFSFLLKLFLILFLTIME